MAPLNASDAWQIILAARQRAPENATRIGDVTITPGGGWQTQHPADLAAAQLFDALLPIAYTRARWVTAQIGQSLDGYIAAQNGDSRYVTGMQSRVHLHRLRALVDTVVVGVGTVIADDPALTVRHVSGPNPARVVLDPHGRAPHGARVFAEGGADVFHAVRDFSLAAPGATPLPLPKADPPEMARALLDELAQRGLQRVLIEGGGITISHFLAARLLDRLHVMVAPILIGSGRRTLTLPEIQTLKSALRPACRSYALGADRLYDLDLRHPAAAADQRPA